MTCRSTPLSSLFLPLLAGVALFGAMALSASTGGLAQDAPPAATAAARAPDSVVATVAGQTITEADLSFTAEDLGQQLANVPADQVRAVLLAQMIELKLMAAAGRAEKLGDDAVFKLRLSYLADRAMRRAYLSKAITAAVTPEAIQAEYDKSVAAMPAEDEVHARHILVSTEDDAKAIKTELAAGADFATLAKEKSIEPGAKQSGGDLGYFTASKMVKPFADAAFAMKVGDISEPVKTQFGWHIIKLEDRRPASKPEFAALSQQIGSQLSEAKYLAMFEALRAAATIDIPDAALKAQVEAQLTPGKPAAPSP